jgi:copper chaperone CopZ
MESSDKSYVYEFSVGMTCQGCTNAINKLMSSESYIKSYEILFEDKKLKVVGGEGVDQKVMERLTKWATASKKELAYVGKTEITA